MEELAELKAYIEEGDYARALNLIGEMEEMSRDDKINKIFSYMEVLLIHLIKQHAENRSTRSWERSVRNALYRLAYVNKRRKAGGYYCKEDELRQIMKDVWPLALFNAAFEAFEGRYSEDEISRKIDENKIKAEAVGKILSAQEKYV